MFPGHRRTPSTQPSPNPAPDDIQETSTTTSYNPYASSRSRSEAGFESRKRQSEAISDESSSKKQKTTSSPNPAPYIRETSTTTSNNPYVESRSEFRATSQGNQQLRLRTLYHALGTCYGVNGGNQDIINMIKNKINTYLPLAFPLRTCRSDLSSCQNSLSSLRTSLENTLTCPITFEMINDPVLGEDGNTYENEFIREWISSHGTSPMTQEQMSDDLRPNRMVKSVINSYEDNMKN